MTAASLQFNKFEIKSNVNDDTVDLRGTGNPIIEYRESVFMPYIEITAYIVDTGNTLPADDGTDAGIGLLESGFCQGTETILFNIADQRGNKITAERSKYFKNTDILEAYGTVEAFDIDNKEDWKAVEIIYKSLR